MNKRITAVCTAYKRCSVRVVFACPGFRQKREEAWKDIEDAFDLITA